MDLVDEPSSPNIIAIFELPGVKNEHITLQIKDKRLIVIGKRVDPYAEALAAAASAATNTGAQPQPANLTLRDGTSPTTATTKSTATNSPNSTPTNKSVREMRYGSFFRSIPVPEGVKVRFVSLRSSELRSDPFLLFYSKLKSLLVSRTVY